MVNKAQAGGSKQYSKKAKKLKERREREKKEAFRQTDGQNKNI